MKNGDIEKNNFQKKQSNITAKPDPETLNTTDPQDNMEGPISTLAKKLSKVMETEQSKEEATELHDKNM